MHLSVLGRQKNPWKGQIWYANICVKHRDMSRVLYWMAQGTAQVRSSSGKDCVCLQFWPCNCHLHGQKLQEELWRLFIHYQMSYYVLKLGGVFSCLRILWANIERLLSQKIYYQKVNYAYLYFTHHFGFCSALWLAYEYTVLKKFRSKNSYPVNIIAIRE